MTRILSLICFQFTVQTCSSSTSLQKHHLSGSPSYLLSLSLKNTSTLPVSWNTLLSYLFWYHIFLRISFSVPSHSPLLISVPICPTSKYGRFFKPGHRNSLSFLRSCWSPWILESLPPRFIISHPDVSFYCQIHTSNCLLNIFMWCFPSQIQYVWKRTGVLSLLHYRHY